MQQRFHLSYHPDFDSALEAKQDQQKRNPDKQYQIRRLSDKRFHLVIRLPINEIKRNPESLIRTRRQRRGRRVSASA